MKKIFTLAAALTAMSSLMAQHAAPMNFIGDASFYLPSNKEQTLTTAAKDTVTVTMGDGNTSTIKVPQMNYAAMNMLMPSFTIPEATWAFDFASFTSIWAEQEFATTTVNASGETKDVAGKFSASYIHSTGAFNLTVTFTYGAMPFDICYTSTGYYTVENEWGLVGRGTQANPYKIYDAADFQRIAAAISADHTGASTTQVTDQTTGETTENTVQEYFQMMNDIDFGGTADAPVMLPSIGKDGITSVTKVEYGFDGVFDGGGHVISGIYHTANGNNPEGKFNGLFASVGSKGVLRNIEMSADNYINSYWYSAPLAAVSQGTIEGCVNRADMTDAGVCAAGIVGYLFGGTGTVRDCHNHGDVKAQTYAAGIVGMTNSGTSLSTYTYVIEDCTNDGNISSANGVGSAGIVGSHSGTVRKCTNAGNIDDSEGTAKNLNYTGGIVATANYAVVIEDCVNQGSVKGGRYVGGIVGYFMKGDNLPVVVSGCSNSGAVTGLGDNIAGIAGFAAAAHTADITLQGCSNSGVVVGGSAETTGNLRGSETFIIGDGCTIAEGLTHYDLDPELSGIKTLSTDDSEATSYDLMGRRTSAKGLILRGGKAIYLQ